MIYFKMSGAINSIMFHDPKNYIYFCFIGPYSDDDEEHELYLYNHCDRASGVKVSSDEMGKLNIIGVDLLWK